MPTDDHDDVGPTTRMDIPTAQKEEARAVDTDPPDQIPWSTWSLIIAILLRAVRMGKPLEMAVVPCTFAC